ncbi:MAG: methyltransferase domain-containing protein [Desulfosalsimonadaceae bacterium]
MIEESGYLLRHRRKLKLGRWRALYLLFIERMDSRSLAEVGSGSPEFLALAPAMISKKHAIDVGTEFQADFARFGVVFHHCDLDQGPAPDLENIEIAICSDVFEHLRNALRALKMIGELLAPEGVLFSHVPNEYLWHDVLPILRGLREGVLYHDGFNEWENPHLRRFTDIGFQRFLQTQFTYNLKITEFFYKKWTRRLAGLGIAPPYCMEPGPTYASTNNAEVYKRLCDIKKKLLLDRKATRKLLFDLYRQGEEWKSE